MIRSPSPPGERTDIDRQLSVLIVDDDHWTTRAISYALVTEPDITLLPPVHSGDNAIDSYRKHQPDVVLMDINMPDGMNGIDATRQIRRMDSEATVVILSTVSPGPGLARALEAGAVAVINKTASESTLRATVRGAARGDDPSMLKFLARDILISGDTLPETPLVTPELTHRELEVLMLICRGQSYEEIAKAQGVSAWTVKTQTKKLREKLQAENLAQLVVRALQYRFYNL
ncbi:response regulator transcription factor [Enteractinococcus helveticum]|uniref:DNA-binding response regulator n=1 Tax=Enteractinococcus helveticum TaxID=1837282 RepID=A0A1B7M2X3_9MICC|nr:response regulator transcription factor [Enteractinococcus helveticum]OAV62943.1 DNA-binding response regulator [Enteractinococcus helveticum]